MRRISLVTATCAVGLSLLLATPAAATILPAHLQDCQGGASNTGSLPIGHPGDQRFGWKEELRNWMNAVTLADVDLTPLVASAGLETFPEAFFSVPPPPHAAACYAAGNWTNLGSHQKRQVEQFWMLSELINSTGSPDLRYTNHPGPDFLLANIENTTTCEVVAPCMQWDLMRSWLADWDYKGNPFFVDPALGNALRYRAGVNLALHLIMLEWDHWRGDFPCDSSPGPSCQNTADDEPPRGPNHNLCRCTGAPVSGLVGENTGASGDELGLMLAQLAFSYRHVKPILQPNVAVAMEAGLLALAKRVYTWGPRGLMLNMDLPSTVALYLVWEATGSPDAEIWYRAHTQRLYGAPFYDRAGYFADNGGFDIGYNNHNLLHAARLAWLDPSVDTWVWEAGKEMFDLSPHLAFPDPDKIWFSPSAFNSRTPFGPTFQSPNSPVGDSRQRYVLGAALGWPFADAVLLHAPAGLQLHAPAGLSTPVFPAPWAPPAVPGNSPLLHRYLACDAMLSMNNMDAVLSGGPIAGCVGNASATAERWPEIGDSRDYMAPQFAVTDPPADFIADWANRLVANPNSGRLPYEWDGPYLRDFNQRFVYAKLGAAGAPGEYAALVHAGPVGPWTSGLSFGLGGGQLAALWSRPTGIALRNARKGRNYGPAVNDDIAELPSWPMHAITAVKNPGAVPGAWTSSAGVQSPSTELSWLVSPPSGMPAWMHLGGSWSMPSANPTCAQPAAGVSSVVGSNAGATGGVVRVVGEIPCGLPTSGSGPTPHILSATLPYQRDFLMGGDGVYVLTRIRPDPVLHQNDTVDQLYETIPILQGRNAEQPNRPFAITFSTSSANINALALPPGSFVDGVQYVYVTRYGGTMAIELPLGGRVGLSAPWSTGTVATGVVQYNVMIDLLPNTPGPHPLPSANVAYRVYMN
jgi:hypothetical protein